MTRGPYLQLLTTHSVTVVWNTATAAACGLAIHPVGGSGTVVAAGAGIVCAVAVDGLAPGTSYAYVPLADGLPLLEESVFATDDAFRPFTFLVLGDSGTGGAAQYAVAGRMLASPADFILHTGDMIYAAGAAADFDPEFFFPYRDLLRRLVLWPCLGNHDVVTSLGTPWRDAFYTPANNAAGSENYYSFDYGNAHVAVLDSNAATSPGSAQYTFLDADLAASPARWKFVAFHHTIYSSSSHGSDLPIQANLVPLFDQRAVDVVFMGHDHDYERTFPLRANAIVPPGTGTVYVTTGGGGQSLYAAGASAFTAHAESASHFTRVAIDGEGLLLQMIGADGLIHDAMTLVKGAPPPPPRCGDGLVNQAGEQCDGADHTACAGGCRPDCTCAPVCGDGVVDQVTETCDGGDDAVCPGRCLADCRCGDPAFEAHVRASADDAEENTTSTSAQYRQVSLTSTDLELVRDLNGATCAGCDQLVGMRWTGVPVPPGARITSAYVQFWVDEAQSEATNLTMTGEATSSAASFTTTAGNLSARPRTAASVAWAVPAWTTVGDHGNAQRTPDLSSIIQQIVDRPGWTSGNSLVLLVTGSGHRTAQAWDLNGGNPTQSALLHIENVPAAATTTSTSSSTSTTVSATSTSTAPSTSSTSSTSTSSSTSTTASTSTTSSTATSTSSSTTTAPPPTTSSTSSSSSSVSSSSSSSTSTTSSSSSTSTSTSSSTTTAPPPTTSSTSSSSSSSRTTTSTTSSSSTTLSAGGTAVYQAGVSGPAASAAVDTYVRLSTTSANYGGDPSLYVGVTNDLTKVFRTLMAFDLSDVPAGVTVRTCTLTMNVTQRTSPTPGHLRRLCGEHWLDGNGQGEAQATWAQWRSGQLWGGAGASSTAACTAGGDYTTADEIAYTPPPGMGAFTFPDLGALCQDAIRNRGGWLRLRISQDAETQTGNVLRFDSSDATSATTRPRLSATW